VIQNCSTLVEETVQVVRDAYDEVRRRKNL
jgi:hypothetical protein